MSKAEDRAIEKYPIEMYEEVGWKCVDKNTHKRQYFIEGYHQAEKDLALTWEDMLVIHKCIKDAMNYHLYKMMEGMKGQKVVYEEVLKRFKERKEK